MENESIVIYDGGSIKSQIEVRLQNDSVWLNLKQMADLFGRDKSVISRHLNNVYEDGELVKDSTVAKNATVQIEGGREVIREVDFYNLDAILSVGYRVNSIQGTRFRIWANRVLRDYLTKGYVIDQKHLQERSRQLEELKQTVKLLGNVAESRRLDSDEATGLLRVVTDYAYALDVLDRYDHQLLEIVATSPKELFRVTYAAALEAIGALKEKLGGSSLFGNEKDESFQGSLAAIYQTFGRKDLYPSVEEKAAHLLYFVTKNHSFTDGNKRIAAFLFVWFLQENGALYRLDGSKKIADNALVALTALM